MIIRGVLVLSQRAFHVTNEPSLLPCRYSLALDFTVSPLSPITAMPYLRLLHLKEKCLRLAVRDSHQTLPIKLRLLSVSYSLTYSLRPPSDSNTALITHSTQSHASEASVFHLFFHHGCAQSRVAHPVSGPT